MTALTPTPMITNPVATAPRTVLQPRAIAARSVQI